MTYIFNIILYVSILCISSFFSLSVLLKLLENVKLIILFLRIIINAKNFFRNLIKKLQHNQKRASMKRRICYCGPWRRKPYLWQLEEDPITEHYKQNPINENPKEDPYHCETWRQRYQRKSSVASRLSICATN